MIFNVLILMENVDVETTTLHALIVFRTKLHGLVPDVKNLLRQNFVPIVEVRVLPLSKVSGVLNAVLMIIHQVIIVQIVDERVIEYVVAIVLNVVIRPINVRISKSVFKW